MSVSDSYEKLESSRLVIFSTIRKLIGVELLLTYLWEI